MGGLVGIGDFATQFGRVVAAAGMLALDDDHAQCIENFGIQAGEKLQTSTLHAPATVKRLGFVLIDIFVQPVLDGLLEAGWAWVTFVRYPIAPAGVRVTLQCGG